MKSAGQSVAAIHRISGRGKSMKENHPCAFVLKMGDLQVFLLKKSTVMIHMVPSYGCGTLMQILNKPLRSIRQPWASHGPLDATCISLKFTLPRTPKTQVPWLQLMLHISPLPSIAWLGPSVSSLNFDEVCSETLLIEYIESVITSRTSWMTSGQLGSIFNATELIQHIFSTNERCRMIIMILILKQAI